VQNPAIRAEGLAKRYRAVAALDHLAFVACEANLWPSLTGAETLHLLGRVHGSVDAAYRDELIARFDLDPAKKVRAYSKGNRQKVILIAALMTRAPLLILDEPTSGLDPLMEEAFRVSIREARDRGQTVFLSSHILSEVEALCDRVAILRAGRLVETGTLAQLRHLSALTVQATFDGPVPDLSLVAGVSSLAVDGQVVRCQVRGPVAPLLIASSAVSYTRVYPTQAARDALNAGLNLDPPTIAIGGVGVLAFGARPRRASVVVYVALGWSLLADIVGGFGGSGPVSRWLLDSSVFHQMASAPAVAPNWPRQRGHAGRRRRLRPARRRRLQPAGSGR
jgi:ABC-type branched-subunit amino acid transport system ATPase component